MKTNVYIRTISVCSHYLTVLRQFPDSVHLWKYTEMPQHSLALGEWCINDEAKLDKLKLKLNMSKKLEVKCTLLQDKIATDKSRERESLLEGSIFESKIIYIKAARIQWKALNAMDMILSVTENEKFRKSLNPQIC